MNTKIKGERTDQQKTTGWGLWQYWTETNTWGKNMFDFCRCRKVFRQTLAGGLPSGYGKYGNERKRGDPYIEIE